jgi:hypothetical protein
VDGLPLADLLGVEFIHILIFVTVIRKWKEFVSFLLVTLLYDFVPLLGKVQILHWTLLGAIGVAMVFVTVVSKLLREMESLNIGFWLLNCTQNFSTIAICLIS